jgi:hypothetical protein
VDDLGGTSVWTGSALLTVNTRTQIEEPNHVTTYPGEAAVWDAATGRWTRLPDAPYVGTDPVSVVWTGRQLLMWGAMSPAHDAGRSSIGVGLALG